MNNEELLVGVTTLHHTPSLQTTGYNEPSTYYPSCSCGWVGLTVHEKWFKEEEKDFNYFAEPWRTVARTYGPEHTLTHGVFGRRETAMKQILTHLSYEPAADHNQTRFCYDEAVEAARGASSDQLLELGKAVERAAREVSYALQRAHIWSNVEVPAVVQQHPEAVRLFAEKAIADEVRRVKEANTPLTAREETALKNSGIIL